VVGINATWNIFDGHATKGRMQATRARRDAAVQALAAARRSVASEVRSAFFDLQQADRVLESETKHVQTADEALDMARGILPPDWEHNLMCCKQPPTSLGRARPD
jgi:outer membrane protein TolC